MANTAVPVTTIKQKTARFMGSAPLCCKYLTSSPRLPCGLMNSLPWSAHQTIGSLASLTPAPSPALRAPSPRRGEGAAYLPHTKDDRVVGVFSRAGPLTRPSGTLSPAGGGRGPRPSAMLRAIAKSSPSPRRGEGWGEGAEINEYTAP